MKYRIKNTVETGYKVKNKDNLGGSVEIGLGFTQVLSKVDKHIILKIIDFLDHTLITDSLELYEFSKRSILIRENNNDFLVAILKAISYFLSYEKIYTIDIEINFENETLTSKNSNLYYEDDFIIKTKGIEC